MGALRSVFPVVSGLKIGQVDEKDKAK